MQGWPFECCHWYFAVCVLPLSYLVAFSNNGFSLSLNWRQVKIKIWKGFFGFYFHCSGEESLFWDYLFHLPEKYYLPSPDKQGGNYSCMWILTGT